MNLKSKTIFTGDNLPIMRGINSNSIDLIYLDPPFNSKANYAAPIGSPAEGAAFSDIWSLNDIDITWLDLLKAKHPRLNTIINAALSRSDKAYLIYMAARLLEMHRVLKDTGSIYLHCDPTMSHWLKIVMDCIFGKANFRNEIVWGYKTGGNSKQHFAKKHDTILFYSKSETYNFTPQKEKSYTKSKSRKPGIINYGKNKAEFFQDEKGVFNYTTMRDFWEISYIGSTSSERTGYPTQKPLTLLERIIKASSNPGDWILDPFCGCATTCVAADRLQRNWIGIDVSEKAAKLVVDRIKDDQGMFKSITHRTDTPKRTDIGTIPRYNHPNNKKHLYGEQKGHCNGCDTHFEMRHLEIDHIIAESVGGTDHIENLQLLCSSCNRIKGDRGQEYLIMRLNS